jgi:hypothetical protein
MSAASVLASYREAAVRLREAAEWNRFDGFFQEGHADRHRRRRGRLIPLVDANVVKFFMDPDHEVHLIDSFASLQAPAHGNAADGNELAAPPHLVTFARVTAEFMFLSSPVCIGGEVGRLWHEVPLITPAHSEETTAMLRRIESKVANLYNRIASRTEADLFADAHLLQVHGEKAVRSVEALSRAGSRAHADPKAFRELVHDVSGSFEQLFAPAVTARARDDRAVRQNEAIGEINALEEGLRWMRLIRETKLRPLLSHPLCNADVLHPPEEEIRRLAEPVAKLKQSVESARRESSTHVARRAWRDATAVVQTTMLNKLAQQQSDGGDPVRFILISGDDILHRVYAEQFWHDGSNRDICPDHYVLRRPLQYIPVMNAKDIPNGYQAKELFDTFLAVLDSVTDFVTPRTHDSFALAYDWRRQMSEPRRQPDNVEMAPFHRLADLWREATIASNALCGGLAAHDFGIKDLVNRLDDFARDAHAVAQLVGLHQQIYRDIDGTQLPLIAQELLSEAVGALRRQAKATRVAGVRMPILIRERFEEVTRNTPIERFLADLAASKGMTDMARLQDIMSRWHRSKVLFFAGAVAAVANNFERAARHLSHAEHLLRTELAGSDPPGSGTAKRRRLELGEISYLRCVVDRLRMRDQKLFDETRRRLRRLVADVPKDSFEYARAMAESGSLLLMRYFNIRFAVEKGAPAGTAAECVHESQRFLDVARHASSVVQRRRTADSELLKVLDAQIHTNTIACHVVQSGFFEGGAAPLRDSVDASLGILENVGGEALDRDHIIGLWDRMAIWLKAPAARRPTEAAGLARFCKSRLHALSKLGDDYQAPSDSLVFEFIAERAGTEATSQVAAR